MNTSIGLVFDKYAMSSLSIERLFGIKGHVAAVTGGSSGLGLMICKVSRASIAKHPES
jgi:hypothetical protein